METNLIQEGRPDIKVKVSWYEYAFDIFSALLVIANWTYFFYYYFDLPDQIPSHFNMQGQVDGYSGKAILYLMPSITTFIFTLFTLLTLIPKRYNYAVQITIENAKTQYKYARVFIRSLRLLVETLLSYILWAMITSAREGRSVLDLLVIFGFVGIEMASVGLYIYLSCKSKGRVSEGEYQEVRV